MGEESVQSFVKGAEGRHISGEGSSTLILLERMGMNGKGPSQEWEVASASLWEGIAPRGMAGTDERRGGEVGGGLSSALSKAHCTEVWGGSGWVDGRGNSQHTVGYATWMNRRELGSPPSPLPPKGRQTRQRPQPWIQSPW